MTIQLSGDCRHCTVPVDSGDTCSFCSTYRPPAEHQHRCTHCGDNQTVPCDRVAVNDPASALDQADNMLRLVRDDLNDFFRMLPADAPLFAVTDLVGALGHLRQACTLIDRAAEQLDAQAAGR